jgi:type IX secretion system PorP/SprF family membrane protein
MKKWLLHIAFLLWYISLAGQQGPQTSLVAFNPYMDHSAYGGMDRLLTITGQARSQWSGLGESPSTQYLSAHMPIYSLSGAAGMDIQSSQAGQLRFSQVRGSYNYVTPFLRGLLSVGGRLGFNQTALDGSSIRTPTGTYVDGSANHNDPVLGINREVGLGVNWEISGLYNANELLIAVSLSDLVVPAQQIGNAIYKSDKTINLYSKYDLQVTESVVLSPNISLRSNLNYTQVDLGANALLGGKNTIGLGLRGYNSTSIDALNIYAGHRVNEKFSIYYAYEIGLSDLRYVNNGTHDLILKYQLNALLGKNLPPKKTYNPRFL